MELCQRGLLARRVHAGYPDGLLTELVLIACLHSSPAKIVRSARPHLLIDSAARQHDSAAQLSSTTQQHTARPHSSTTQLDNAA